MKRTLALMMVLLIAVSMSLVARPTAETQYAAIHDQVLSLTEAKKAYDGLASAIAAERESAQKNLVTAQRSGDRLAWREARLNLAKLSTYVMSRAQSDALVSEILELEEAERAQWATWLASVSPYWRPTLTLDFSSSGDGYRYSYRQTITQKPGVEVTLPRASQIRFNSRQVGVLVGWGITPDALTWAEGETIAMPYTDQTLYAIYQEGVRFVDERSNTDRFYSLDAVTVPTPQAPSEGAVFSGWWDRTTATLIDDPASYAPQGKGGYFEALWKELVIDDVALLYYRSDNAPTNTQLSLGFSYSNVGTVDLRGLVATLSSDSEYVTILRPTIALGSLASGYRATNNSRWPTRARQLVSGQGNVMRLVISKDAPSGTVIPLTLTISSASGEAWSATYPLTVR